MLSREAEGRAKALRMGTVCVGIGWREVICMLENAILLLMNTL